MPDLPEELVQRLREAGADELRALLRELGDALDVPAAQAVMRNPHAGEDVLRLLAAEKRLLASYEMRRDLALHAATPQPIALALIGGLYWKDLVAAGLDVRIRPVVRRFADQRLIERLPGLAAGEKASIARSASPHVLQVLRHDPTPRVIASLLDNPRLVEADLLPLASGEAAQTPVLAVILGHRKWGNRYPVRLAVVRNPRAPLQLAMQHLAMLKKPDLRAVAADARLALPLRRKAELLSGSV
ncbi:MAG TPA: hypothetical protein VGS57_02685 [Thermoanaerobaculia bacterium]|jgi:hypothetical protein|nr:hypothetical protein [Thermoanaerobaculia bacterium]